jgi:hypothetical protein
MQFNFIAIRLQLLWTLCNMHLVQIEDIFKIWINLSIQFLKTSTTSAKLGRDPPSEALACSMATPASFASLASCCPYKKILLQLQIFRNRSDQSTLVWDKITK